MKIFDISQEVFGCSTFPGDPKPEKTNICVMENGDLYNLSSFSMCAHNGTHVDAPKHFYIDGNPIDKIPLDAFIGHAYVTSHDGVVSSSDAENMLKKAIAADPRSVARILIKGPATVSEDAAAVFAEAGILLIGNESQTVGPENAPMKTHLILLNKHIVLLEGIRLQNVDDGVYLLNCAPINLGGFEGAPCRAVLISDC